MKFSNELGFKILSTVNGLWDIFITRARGYIILGPRNPFQGKSEKRQIHEILVEFIKYLQAASVKSQDTKTASEHTLWLVARSLELLSPFFIFRLVQSRS